MMGLSDKKEAIIDMVEMLQDEATVDHLIDYLKDEIKIEIEKGLISP